MKTYYVMNQFNEIIHYFTCDEKYLNEMKELYKDCYIYEYHCVYEPPVDNTLTG
jgi:hypothetical protein